MIEHPEPTSAVPLRCSVAMQTASTAPPPEPMALWYIGQHDTSRSEKVTGELLHRAQDLGYDMLTSPITTAHFQQRVTEQLQAHLEKLSTADRPDNVPFPLVAPLTPADTDLTPDDSNSALIAMLSGWIDLGSSDPVVAHVSRQVFNLEVAYAAFCGIQNIVVHGPILDSDIMQFARAVQEGLGMGPYLQFQVLLPMTGEQELATCEGSHLAEFARGTHATMPEEEDPPEDVFGAWDTWDAVRTVCEYSSRLSIGK